jgi:hypothetical protein
VIGYLEAEIIFEFSQEIMKICEAARNLDTSVNFNRSGRYNPRRYSTGETPPIKAIRSLEVYMSERQHIYEDLNESSSARPGESQQLKVLPSPNSKRTPNFSAHILARCRNFNGIMV